MTSHSRTRTEYLILTYDIVVLDLYFNLTNNILSHWRALMLFNTFSFDDSVVAYFLGHSVYSLMFYRCFY